MKRKVNLWFIFGTLLITAALILSGYNILDEARAVTDSNDVLIELVPEVKEKTEDIPDYQIIPEMEMPIIEIDGNEYIGVLEITSRELVLPVMSEWSYPKLKISPCRYSGSIYKNDMIICAHNYESHFGTLKSLAQGDQIKFTDVDGNIFLYEVAELEILDPYATEEIVSGDWDLTLFTCTYGGQNRVTVRCIMIE